MENKYQKLRVLSYASQNRQFNIEEEYKKRFESYSTVHTDILIYPFLNEQKVLDKQFEIFYVPLPEMTKKIEKIKYNSERIRNILKSGDIPGVARNRIFIATIIDEIQSTNETEGISSTKYEIAKAIEERNNRKTRFNGIVNMYLKLNEKNYDSIEERKDLRTIYDFLFKGEEDDIDEWPDGNLFRSDQVELKNEGDGKVVHRGEVDEPRINEAVDKLINLMNRRDIHFIEKCLLSHYYLEYIHPFYDGNGRLGRYIVSSYLSRKLDSYTGLSISSAVNNNRKKYYAAFSEVTNPKNRGEMTHFLLDMMDLIILGQEKSIDLLEEAALKMGQAEQYLKTLDEIKEMHYQVLFILIQDNVFSLFSDIEDREISQVLKVSNYKLKPILEDLKETGYIKKIKKSPSKHSITDKVIECLDIY